MPETTERPLVTFAVIAYNQERFIREAIEGAFAQTYHPLEIILSDDCSSDRTYQIMKEMAAAYDGPHKVVLNRNEANLGIVQHFNKIFEMSSGYFVCVNAGDDYSRVDRVEFLYKIWVSSGRRHNIIHTTAYNVDEFSNVLGLSKPRKNIQKQELSPNDVATNFLTAIGATFMYNKKLFEVFGKLPSFAEVEDRPMIFRASLCGGILFVDEPLVYHRTGGISFPKQEALGYLILFGGRIKTLSWRVSSAKCYLSDLKDFPDQCFGINKDKIKTFIKNGEWEIKLSQKSYIQRFSLLPEAFARASKSHDFKPMRSYIKYLLWPAYYIFLNLKSNKDKIG